MTDPAGPRLHAYVMLADIAWLPASIGSYYAAVDKLLVSHDVGRRAWNGSDLSAEIARGRRLIADFDLDGKVEWLERDFVASDGDLAAADTRQRQASLDAASVGADWVIQLDTDEVVPDLAHFVAAIGDADREGYDGLEYSARWLHTHIGGRWFTERSTRRLRFWDGIAGPVAVRAGTTLRFMRQTDAPCRRLTVNPGADATIPLDKAILHFSMVRSDASVRWKAASSSHANDFDWSPKVRQWVELDEHPVRGILRSVLRPIDQGITYRPARLAERYSNDLVAEQVALGDPTSLRADHPEAAPAARVLAFHLPQFHPIPENDEWWGPGFTEWTNTAKARKRFPGHYQPHVPGELGFYDLRLPETRADQAQLARDHGIEGFVYWHYWFGHGRRILERPVDEIVASGEPDLPFALGWANQTWTGIWHGLTNRVLIEQTYPGPDDERAHFEHLLPAFTDPRYLTVGGKPVFYVFRPEELPDAARFVAHWQELAVDAGLPGLFILAESSDLLGTGPAYTSSLADGFDASVAMRLPAHTAGVSHLAMRALRKARVGQVLRYSARPQPTPAIPGRGRTYPTVYPNWDNSPRSGKRAVILHGSTPARFRPHVAQAIAEVRDLPPDERLVFVKSWNEWAEGNHLEPDQRFGRGYLEVLRDEAFRGSAS